MKLIEDAIVAQKHLYTIMQPKDAFVQLLHLSGTKAQENVVTPILQEILHQALHQAALHQDLALHQAQHQLPQHRALAH